MSKCDVCGRDAKAPTNRGRDGVCHRGDDAIETYECEAMGREHAELRVAELSAEITRLREALREPVSWELDEALSDFATGNSRGVNLMTALRKFLERRRAAAALTASGAEKNDAAAPPTAG